MRASTRTARSITAADLAPAFTEIARGVLVNAAGTVQATIDNEDGPVVLAEVPDDGLPGPWSVTFSPSTPVAVVFAAIEAAS